MGAEPMDQWMDGTAQKAIDVERKRMGSWNSIEFNSSCGLTTPCGNKDH